MTEDYEQLMKLRPESLSPSDAAPTIDIKTAALVASSYKQTVQSLYDESQTALRHELLGRIHAMSFQFFERLIIDLLLAMGYGARRRDLSRSVGKSHDGGIDGIIAQDELGLEQIYVQAKRLRPGSVVAVSDVRNFAGSLEAAHANKGIFVTTGQFSPASLEFARAVTRRLVLMDGVQLTDMMIRHNLGVATVETFQVKHLEAAYFAPQKLPV